MSDARYYMVCVDLRDRPCLVVGAGRVAAEKARGLLDCGADVTVVAPEIDEEVAALPVTLLQRAFRRSDVVRRFLVIAATNDRLVNTAVSAVCGECGTPCNVADDPELCSFILPAIARRDPIVVGVSTGGASPALAQRIRDDVEDLLSPRHAEVARMLHDLRPWAKRELATYEERRDFFRRVVAEALA
jgi:siroheme synthase-like protein